MVDYLNDFILFRQALNQFRQAEKDYNEGEITREQYAKAHGVWWDTVIKFEKSIPWHSCTKCPINGCPKCHHDVQMIDDMPFCRHCEKRELREAIKKERKLEVQYCKCQ